MVSAAVVLIGVVVAVLFLTGVLGGSDEKDKAASPTPKPTPTATQTEAPPTTTEPAPETTSTAQPTETPTAQPTQGTGGFSGNGVLGFGDTATWDDGVEVTIDRPVAYTPDDTAAGYYGTGTAMRFVVNVKNGSEVDLEPLMIMIDVRSAGQSGERIFDFINNIDLPMEPIAPGASLAWDVAFEVDNPEDMRISVAPTWEHNEVYFQN